MPRNGGGVFSLPGTYEAISGQTIEAQQHNDPLEDLESDMNAARPVVAGGTGATTAAGARTNLLGSGVATTVDNTIPRFDGVTGALQTSTASIDDSGNLVVAGAATVAGDITLTSTDTGAAAAPVLTLYRNSASPAASDIAGKILFQGEDSAGNTEDYAEISQVIDDPTSTSEDASLLFRTKVAGTMTTHLSFAAAGAAFSTGVTFSAIPLLSGGGIKFPATQVPSGDANTLDDYEEGSFTPGMSFGGGTTGITYTSQTGSYQKVGNRVHVQGRVSISSKGSSTGTTRLTGLPFAVGGGLPSFVIAESSGFNVASGLSGALGDSGATTATIEQDRTTGSSVINDTHVNGTTTFFFSGTYEV